MPSDQTYVQRDQPPGVPPLELTGERTLPDVPEENYWFRRHLVVYEALAPRCRGVVLEAGCGEGYGADLLAGGEAGAEKLAKKLGIPKQHVYSYREKYQKSLLARMQKRGHTAESTARRPR